MKILAIETSCDETGAAILEKDKKSERVSLVSNIVASSLSLHSQTGGIIPEVAAREQVKYIIPTLSSVLKSVKNPKKDIDAIAVTIGPGLIGSLLVGVETAKTISYVWDKPIIGVNHLFGHIYANWIDQDKEILFPLISLVVSGGHTDLVLLKNHRDIVWLGGTRDDAAGEAFDKIGRLMGLPYPSGPKIEHLSKKVKKDIYNFPRPLISENSFDFSFSGLKTAALREVEKIKKEKGELSEKDIESLSLATQNAISEVLIKKTLKACSKYNVKSLILGGGVAANQTLREGFENQIKNQNLNLDFYVPPRTLCTDNAAMIGAAALFKDGFTTWSKLDANPELYFD